VPFKDNLSSVFRNATQVIYRGGLAGKICYVLISFAASIAIIVGATGSINVAYTGLTMMFILFTFVLRRLINLADKNPQAALMDGAQYLVHERILVGAKNQPMLPLTEEDKSENAPIELTQNELNDLNEPEEELPQSKEEPIQLESRSE